MNNLMTKSFLSYADLKKEAMKDLEAGGGDEEAFSVDIEMSKADKTLQPFFEEAEMVKEEMASIRRLLSLLEAADEKGKSSHNPEETHVLRTSINSHIADVLKIARRIRGRLEGMDRANAANRRLSGCREGTLVDRTRSAVTNGLRNKLKEMMMDFQGLRQRMMDDYKGEVERHYFAATGEMPAEEMVEKMVFEGKSEVRSTAREIRDRHDAVKEVEKSLLELHQVFMDMAIMVEAQGEKMDDIEHHVNSASHYIRGGTKELDSAKSYHRKSRKWFCIAIIILLVLVILIIIPVTTSLRKS